MIMKDVFLFCFRRFISGFPSSLLVGVMVRVPVESSDRNLSSRHLDTVSPNHSSAFSFKVSKFALSFGVIGIDYM